MILIPPCCSHPEHARPWRDADGTVTTGSHINDAANWETWTEREWRMHCSNFRNGNMRRERTDAA